MQMGTIIKGADNLRRDIDRTREKQQRAVKAAIKIEAFRKKNLLQAEIRKRAPGGHRHQPLTFVAQRMKSPAVRRKMRKPGTKRRGGQSSIDKAVRYEVRSARHFEVALGFVKASGPSWQYFADIQQRGFVRTLSDRQRRLFVGVGAALGTIEGGDTPFFLSKNKGHMRTPARPIIKPFRIRYRSEIVRNIASHYSAKMAGRRI